MAYMQSPRVFKKNMDGLVEVKCDKSTILPMVGVASHLC